MECRVEYDYVAQEEDELTLKKGDIITSVVQKMEGWWEGSLRGKTGMFPDNFVKVIEKSNSSKVVDAETEPVTQKSDPGNNSVTLRNNTGKASVRRLKALFSYAPEQEDELKLDIGDVVEFITEVEEGWWRGKLKGRVGIFPSNFVSEYEPPTTNGKVDALDQKQNDLSKVNHSKGIPDVVPPVPTSDLPAEDEPAPELPPKPVRELARCFYPYQAQNEDELQLNEGDIVTIISKNCEDDGWWRGENKGKTGLFPDNFVKIIPANEILNQNKSITTPTQAHTTKISPQVRNLTGVQPILSGDINTNEVSNGTSVVDGLSGSKIQDKEKESVSSKVARFSKSSINFNPPIKPTTPTSPTGGLSSPMSLPIGFSGKRDSRVEEVGDFNVVERGEEKLYHLTFGRAKAPKRRPPSAIITKDSEENENLVNGSIHSQESLDSPHVNNSTPFNSTFNSSVSSSNNTSTSVLDTSGVSGGGSFLSQSMDKDSAISPTSGTTSAPKPKKLLPWMAELKQTQDKKRGLTSPGATSNTSSNISSITGSSSSLPPVSPSAVVQAKEKEIITPPVVSKAPPLPAKPTSLAPSSSIEKISSSSPSIVTVPTTTAPAPIVTNRNFGKKPPIHNNSNQVNSSGGHDTNSGGGSGDSRNVSYEEYAKLRDRVVILETELETVRRQVKLLLDRELNHGHIV